MGTVFEMWLTVLGGTLLVLNLVIKVHSGCKFANQKLPESRINDLDAAKFAAKMALAHQGMDIETLKERQKRRQEEEPYIPTFETARDEREETSQEETVKEGNIWELSERS